MSRKLTEPLRMAADFAKASRAASTIPAYQNDMLVYSRWCEQRGLAIMPIMPASVCAFIADEAAARRKASTISRRIAALKFYAKPDKPTDDERVKATLAGIKRSIGSAPVRKRAATSDIVLGMVGTLGNETLRQARDRALLLIAFASALRRSEPVALDVADLEWTAEGVLIRIRKSKADQEGTGASVAVPKGETACPVTALPAPRRMRAECLWVEAEPLRAGFHDIGDGAACRRPSGRADQNRLNRRRRRVLQRCST